VLLAVGIAAAFSGCTRSEKERLPVGTATSRPLPAVTATTVPVVATATPTPGYVSRRAVAADTLRIPIQALPGVIDPQAPADPELMSVLHLLYEPLFLMSNDGSVSEGAADRIEWSADLKQLTVHLREGLTWLDGVPLTAAHYRDGLCRLLAPSTANPAGSWFAADSAILGAEAFAAGAAPGCEGVGIRAVSPNRLEFSLVRPVSYLPELLAALSLPVRNDRQPGSGSLMTCGAYEVTEQSNVALALRRRPQVSSSGAARIEFVVQSGGAAQIAEFKQGELDVASVPITLTGSVRAIPGLGSELQTWPRAGASYLVLNPAQQALAEVNVRRQLLSRVDRKALAAAISGGEPMSLAAGVIPEGLAPVSAGAQGPASAAASAPGLSISKHSVTIATSRSGQNEAIVALLASAWEEAGWPVWVTSSAPGTYAGAVANCSAFGEACSLQAFTWGWQARYGDAGDILRNLPLPAKGGWRFDEYRKLIDQAAGEPDRVRRAKVYRQAEALLIDDAVILPLWEYRQFVLVRAGVRGQPMPSGIVEWSRWQVPN
jgi:oligopeptide transport system substrate-binding protein